MQTVKLWKLQQFNFHQMFFFSFVDFKESSLRMLVLLMAISLRSKTNLNASPKARTCWDIMWNGSIPIESLNWSVPMVSIRFHHFGWHLLFRIHCRCLFSIFTSKSCWNGLNLHTCVFHKSVNCIYLPFFSVWQL